MDPSGLAYVFGPYKVDVAARRLLVDGAEVPLNGKAFELLLIFVQSGGAALSRDRLYEELWPNAVVEDGNLSQNVYLVRRALDRGDGRQFIETIPRFGYRFNATVRSRENASSRRVRAGIRVAVALLAAALLSVAGSSAARGRPPLSATAREAYALGAYHIHLRTKRELGYARNYFKQTIHAAPLEAAGYAGVASTYALLAEYYPAGSRAQMQYLGLARKYRDEALARDGQNSDALAVAGFIAYRFEQNAAQAQRYLSAALASDPDNAAAYHWHGVLMLIEGNTSDAVRDLETAHRLDPTSEIFTRWLARTYEYSGRTGDALAMTTQALQIEPSDNGSLIVRAMAQEQRGDLRGALQTLRRLARVPSEMPIVEPDTARIEVLLHRIQARKLTARVDSAVAHGRADPFEAVLFYFTVGLPDKANALLRAMHPPLVTAGLNAIDPRYVALRSRPANR